MKEVIERPEVGVVNRRGVRHLLVAVVASTAMGSVQAAKQDPALLGTALTPLGGGSGKC